MVALMAMVLVVTDRAVEVVVQVEHAETGPNRSMMTLRQYLMSLEQADRLEVLLQPLVFCTTPQVKMALTILTLLT